jgi:hypothetical protein
MVNSDSTIPTETKIKAYGSLAETNKAWGSIITHTVELEQAGFLTPVQSERFRLVAQEFQADMNYCITNSLCTKETEEAGHYGKLRIALEERLNRHEEPNAEKKNE